MCNVYSNVYIAIMAECVVALTLLSKTVRHLSSMRWLALSAEQFENFVGIGNNPTAGQSKNKYDVEYTRLPVVPLSRP